ncbi:hypothetical protein SEA_TIERRA_5 [Mycobacterium phage Tierra]|uniref:Uncharacterized protein n=4 Tax=Unicornvirus TaxID=2948939 RepID=A0A222ZLA9_9CAUD|nr:hypothetical protein I5G78_gp100 [Mycobacterium phage Unicorn]YP_009951284.1 hypothetical protein I5G79_gp92 [Mycobacterium phage Bryler]YP_009951377.1 hypothetical protein I5G80_gp005 [Mycobacterium phage Krueger]YP_009951573.1 hypothetical protein I5G82_gp101 [Mycobacterium phage Ximenita]ASR85117.1 hypothetical protein SEA_PHELPSODU_5 [Mycobacterium phage PhelpsODU]ASR85304.1 hypothetical protein SEA_PHRANK_5 [Mycobacterium phage Phrank]ASR85405.1 hypothetical protein SEA_CAIN_5 [Mycoba
MEAPSTIEVPCPACGEPIVLSIGFEVAVPEPGADSAPVYVTTPDLADRAQAHGEVCPVLAGGGC